MPPQVPSPPLPRARAGWGTPGRFGCAGMAGAEAGGDPAKETTDTTQYYVGQDQETKEYVQLWLQRDSRRDSRAVTKPTPNHKGTTAYGYIMRRSTGKSCLDEQGWHLCKRVHLCKEHPCRSIPWRKDGSIDHSKYGLYTAPWHLLERKDLEWLDGSSEPTEVQRAAAAAGPPAAAPGHGRPREDPPPAGCAAAAVAPGQPAAAAEPAQPHAGGGAPPAGQAGTDQERASAGGLAPPHERKGRVLPPSFGTAGSLGDTGSPAPAPAGEDAPAGPPGPPTAQASPAGRELEASPGPPTDPASPGPPTTQASLAEAAPEAGGIAAAGHEPPPRGTPAPPTTAAAEPPTRDPVLDEHPAESTQGSGSAATGAPGPAAATGAGAGPGTHTPAGPPALSPREALARTLAAGQEAAARAGAAVRLPEAAPLPLRPTAPALTDADDSGGHAPSVAVELLAPPRESGQGADSQGALSKLLDLTRQVRRPHAPIGHAAFVVLGLAREMKVRVWEGRHRVDVTRAYLPGWAYDELRDTAPTDAVLCAPVPQDAGPPKWAPVSEDRPARACNHYSSLLFTGNLDMEGDESCIDGFYARLGYAVVETVADGDCGIDAMLRMVGTTSTLEARGALRQDWHMRARGTHAARPAPATDHPSATDRFTPWLIDSLTGWSIHSLVDRWTGSLLCPRVRSSGTTWWIA